MIDRSTFDYLRDLEHHNEREWFEAHRDRYEAMRGNLVEVAEDLLGAAEVFDVRVREVNPDPKACVSRTHRDLRFNKGNKPPYKTDAFITLGSAGEATSSASYYVHIERGTATPAAASSPPNPTCSPGSAGGSAPPTTTGWEWWSPSR